MQSEVHLSACVDDSVWNIVSGERIVLCEAADAGVHESEPETLKSPQPGGKARRRSANTMQRRQLSLPSRMLQTSTWRWDCIQPVKLRTLATWRLQVTDLPLEMILAFGIDQAQNLTKTWLMFVLRQPSQNAGRG